VAWLGSICFVLQVYFDFSGYSDMAIGLGRMFGFRFLENFNYPYIARSITEFWQRWHISLSTWFRDYLYFPLGGSRRGRARTYFNLITIFFLCGLWHGARWNYVIWGLSHGLFMVVERLWLGKRLSRLWPPLAVFYMMFVFTTTLTIFRTNSIPHAIDYLTVMFGFGPEIPAGAAAWIHVEADVRAAIIAGIIFSFPVLAPLRRLAGSPVIRSRPLASSLLNGGGPWVKTAVLGAILYVSILVLSSQAYEPFIYFRF
jgi:alginate O-acetyltransferase complex protein AlgI